MLGASVAEGDVPDDVLPLVVGLNLGAQGHKVGIAAHVDGVFGAQLHAGVALGAHIRLLVAALVDDAVQDHQVVGTDIDALGAAMDAGAGVAGGGIDIGRHSRFSSGWAIIRPGGKKSAGNCNIKRWPA